MTKFMTCETWFVKHVIHEICQNLHMKWDHDCLPLATVTVTAPVNYTWKGIIKLAPRGHLKITKFKCYDLGERRYTCGTVKLRKFTGVCMVVGKFVQVRTKHRSRVHGPPVHVLSSLSWSGSMDPLSWTGSMDTFFKITRIEQKQK